VPMCTHAQGSAHTGDGADDTSVRASGRRHRGGRHGVETPGGASAAEESSTHGKDHWSRRV